MMKLSLFCMLSMAVTLSQASVSMHNPFYCFDTDPVRPQNSMFATKTAYEAVRGNGFINPSISSKQQIESHFTVFCHSDSLNCLQLALLENSSCTADMAQDCRRAVTPDACMQFMKV